MDNQTPFIDPSTRFTKTRQVLKKERNEALAKGLFSLMAAMAILPLAAILLYLFIEAIPSLNLEFLLDVPRKGMTEGGIWAAFGGTLYPAVISIARPAPAGITAAVFLNESAHGHL
ncbi:hypothetical protein FDZ71_09255 [bacterium]|nr:MAG: hypothetical protein FDZ71_09255 [bacterium]